MVNKETDSEKLMGFCLIVMLLVPITLWRAYVLTIIYSWYAPGSWPEITMRVAIGLCLIVGMLSVRPNDKESPPMAKALVNSILYGGLTPLLSLGFARIMLWIV